MDMIEFSKQVPSENLARIFKDFFEQPVVASDILKGIKFNGINSIDFNKSSIVYSVKLLSDKNKEQLVNNLNGITLNIYGKEYKPSVFMNGDLLCITISK